MSEHLERCIRAYVAQAFRTYDGSESDLPPKRVMPGNAKGPRWKESYATLLLRTDQRRSYPEHRGLHDATGMLTGTLQVEPRRATFSLQFYRDGAVELAERFDRWAQSEIGLLQAQTSFASGGGSLRHIRVLQVGSGYTDAPAVTIEGRYRVGSGAAATASVASGAVSGIALDAPGKDYTDVLKCDLTRTGCERADPIKCSDECLTSGITIADPPDPSGETATATAIGWGHAVVFPLQIRRLDLILGDAFEERSQVDLSIDYTHWNTDAIAATGAVTSWDWELFGGC